MPFEIEETGELTRTANVTVPAADYEKKVNAALRKLSGRVKIKGFRKGKIPLPVLKQRYGASVTQDVVQELVNEQIRALLDDVGSVLHLGTPQVNAIPLDGEGNLSFTIDLELRPQIDPIGYLGMEVEKPVVEIGDDEITAALEDLREQHSSLEPVVLRETISAGDVVTLDFKSLSEHEELKEIQSDDVQFKVGAGQVLEGIDEAVTGAGFTDTVEASIELDENYPTEELRGESVKLELKIKKVEREVFPELDDDFAQKTGDGETLLELRSNLRKRLQEQREEEARDLAIADMMERLLDQNPFTLPPAFLQEQVEDSARRRFQMLSQQGLNPEQFGLTLDALQEEIRDDVDRQVREELLLMEIAQKEKIKVEEEDLMAHLEKIAGNMGISAQQYLAYMRQNPQSLQQLQGGVLLDKTRDHLLDEATITEVPWPEQEEPAEEEAAEEGEEEEVDASGSDEDDEDKE